MSKFRLVRASTIALAFSVFSSGFVAQAAAAPSLVIANTGESLVGSVVSDFDPTVTLRLELTTSSGAITIALGTSGALVTPGFALKGATVGIIGTQAQINAALAGATLSKNCTTTRTITGKVTVGPDDLVFNPANGHWYGNVAGGLSWDDAKLAAAAKTLPNTTGRGYLATITSAEENTFLNDNFSATPLIGGSDAVTEGDWYWADGPEAGTKFFSNGAAVGGSYTNWGAGEPNNSGNEDYLHLWGGDTWNDIAGDGYYLVEFGGMAGDDFSGFSVVTATATGAVTVPVLLEGDGTLSHPYLITNEADFAGLASCSAIGLRFQQTQDIVFSNTFVGGVSFSGHYDGNGKKLDASAATQLNNGIFASISGSAAATETSVRDLDVVGSLTQQGMGCGNAVFARSINFATIDNVNLTNAKISSDCEGGLLARSISNSVVKNSSVTGEIDVMMFVMGAGGLAATANSTQFINNECNVTFGLSDFMPFVDMVESLGGCVGRSNNSSFTDVHSSGSINLTNQEMGPMMMMLRSLGGLIGESYMDTITDSSSSVSITSSRGNGVGGLIGISNLSTINRSFATGTISDTDGYEIGGLIGYSAASNISNSYATGAVTTNQYGGSLIGSMQSGSTVSKSYATGLVTVSQGGESRGLVGNSDSTNLTDSYWKILSTGIPSTIESFGQEVPKHSGDLKKISTFANWNISATPSSAHDWAICPGANGGYPYLAWQEPANACARSFTSGATATVNGLAYVGGTISATPGNWDPLATMSYQWYEGTTAITGATTSYFRPNLALKGKSISVKVTGAKAGYISTEVSSTSVVVASAPLTSTVVIGGFAAKSGKLTPAAKAAVAKTLKGLGVALSIKCEGFATAKKLTAAQKKLAATRAAAVCSAMKVAQASSSVKSAAVIASKLDKLKEGVRVTVTSVKR